jgi:hypothetical protein
VKEWLTAYGGVEIPGTSLAARTELDKPPFPRTVVGRPREHASLDHFVSSAFAVPDPLLLPPTETFSNVVVTDALAIILEIA